MQYKGKRKMTRATIKAARIRREKMFAGMTAEEIRNQIPIVKAYFYEYQLTKGIGLFIPECPICGETHLHGADISGSYHRSTHCAITDEPIPHNYQLQIDWEDEDNIRLAKKYDIPINDV